MKTVFQENYPARARTYRSTAEAFRDLRYACAIEVYKPGRIRDWLYWLTAFALPFLVYCWSCK